MNPCLPRLAYFTTRTTDRYSRKRTHGNALTIPGAQQAQPAQGMPPQSPSYPSYGGPPDPNAYMAQGYPGQPPAAQYFQPPGHEQQPQGMTWGPAPGVQHTNQYGRR